MLDLMDRINHLMNNVAVKDFIAYTFIGLAY